MKPHSAAQACPRAYANDRMEHLTAAFRMPSLPSGAYPHINVSLTACKCGRGAKGTPGCMIAYKQQLVPRHVWNAPYPNKLTFWFQSHSIVISPNKNPPRQTNQCEHTTVASVTLANSLHRTAHRLCFNPAVWLCNAPETSKNIRQVQQQYNLVVTHQHHSHYVVD